jgi:phosphatidylinositol alpha-1,6-mannosyltransferase
MVTLDFPPSVGGIQTYLAELACRLPGVSVLAPAAPGDTEADRALPFPVERVELARAGGWSSVPALVVRTLAHLSRGGWDGVLLGHPKLAAAAPLIARWHGLPSAVFAYGMDVTCGRLKRLEAWGMARAWRVVTISRYTAGHLERIGVPSDRVRIVAPGVDPSGLPAVPGHAELSPPVLLTVGRIEPAEGYKGHDLILDCLPRIRRAVPDVRWVVAGGGSGLAALASEVRRRGLESAVELVGPIRSDQLAERYRSCAAYVMPVRTVRDAAGERFEGFGIVYLEAALHARPVVATRAGGVPEAVVDGETGLLVEAGDVEALAAAILRILREPELAKRLGERGRERVLASFTWERSAAALLAMLSELTESCRR